MSSRERRFRDQVMLAVRRKIAGDRIPCSEIIVSNRPMLTAVRARILRDEWDDISLRRAILIADAVGVDLVPDIIRGEVAKAEKPKATARRPQMTPAQRLALVLEKARAEQAMRRRPQRSDRALGDLFEIAA